MREDNLPIPPTATAVHQPYFMMPDMDMAYIKPLMTDKGQAFAVCSSEGDILAIFPTEEAAFYSAQQHELRPMLLN